MEERKACTLFYCFSGVMHALKDFKIRVKIMEIKSAELNASLN